MKGEGVRALPPNEGGLGSLILHLSTFHFLCNGLFTGDSKQFRSDFLFNSKDPAPGEMNCTLIHFDGGHWTVIHAE